MANKSDNTAESTTIGPGDLLAFGSVNLLLTLNLDENDLTKYKLNWENLSSLNDLKFIINHQKFWKRIELTSNNEAMNVILYINKTSPKLIKIGYVGLKKIILKEKEKNFEDFIFSVTRQHGLFITSCDICNCNISIQLLLKYEEKEKIFLLCGKSVDIKKPKNDLGKINNNNEENENNKYNDEIKVNEKILYENDKNNDKEENKKEQENNNNSGENSKKEKNEAIYSTIGGKKKKKKKNPFIIIYENNINTSEFNYIYFNFCDIKIILFCLNN
jgi:hypothetical protein